ncbi:hypothetical protein ABPG72_022139 [Tetrahymena utriculariae]
MHRLQIFKIITYIIVDPLNAIQLKGKLELSIAEIICIGITLPVKKKKKKVSPSLCFSKIKIYSEYRIPTNKIREFAHKLKYFRKKITVKWLDDKIAIVKIEISMLLKLQEKHSVAIFGRLTLIIYNLSKLKNILQLIALFCCWYFYSKRYD